MCVILQIWNWWKRSATRSRRQLDTKRAEQQEIESDDSDWMPLASLKAICEETSLAKRSRQLPSHFCELCQTRFASLKAFRAHRKLHKPDGSEEGRATEEPRYDFDPVQDLYVCGVCSAEFQQETEAKTHASTHVERIACATCDAPFKDYVALGLHSAEHSADNRIACPLCPHTSSNRNPYTFKAHINYVHLKRFPFYCRECGRGFKHAKTYEDHQNLHAGLKPYACVVCDKAFLCQKYLHVHQVRGHQVSTTGTKIANECRTCYRSFYKPEALDEHAEACYKKRRRVARGDGAPAKAFLCDACGQTFTEKAKLVEHLRVHSGELPYGCNWCAKRFPARSYLKTHERVHTGEKPYSCEFCGKRFAQHAPFRVHRRTHTGERPYVCDFCSRGFTTNQSLKSHKRNCPHNQLEKMFRDEIGYMNDPSTTIV